MEICNLAHSSPSYLHFISTFCGLTHCQFCYLPLYPVMSVLILKASCLHSEFCTSCTFSCVFQVSDAKNGPSFISHLFNLSGSLLYLQHTDFLLQLYGLYPSAIFRSIFSNLLTSTHVFTFCL
jgi:hypothetical protein